MKRSPIKRKTPLKAKRATPRRIRSPRCTVRGCTRIARVLTYCKSHAEREADRLFSLYIRSRDGRCMLRTEAPCVGSLQCCHIMSRGYHRVRYDPQNAWAGCAGHHRFYTDRDIEWEEFCIRVMGQRERDLLKWRALHDPMPDLAEVIKRYTRLLSDVG